MADYSSLTLITFWVLLCSTSSGRWTSHKLSQFHKLRTGSTFPSRHSFNGIAKIKGKSRNENGEVYWHFKGTLMNEYTGKALANVEGVETCRSLSCIEESMGGKDNIELSQLPLSASLNTWQPLINKLIFKKTPKSYFPSSLRMNFLSTSPQLQVDRTKADEYETALLPTMQDSSIILSSKMFGYYNLSPQDVKSATPPSSYWQWFKVPFTANFIPTNVPKGETSQRQVIMYRLKSPNSTSQPGGSKLIVSTVFENSEKVTSIEEGSSSLSCSRVLQLPQREVLSPKNRARFTPQFHFELFASNEMKFENENDTDLKRKRANDKNESMTRSNEGVRKQYYSKTKKRTVEFTRFLFQKLKNQKWVGIAGGMKGVFGGVESLEPKTREEYVYYYGWDCGYRQNTSPPASTSVVSKTTHLSQRNMNTTSFSLMKWMKRIPIIRIRPMLLYRRTGRCPSWCAASVSPSHNLCTLEIRGVRYDDKEKLSSALLWMNSTDRKRE